MCSNHLACRIYALGSAVLFGTSFPAEMRSNVAPIGFILGSILIAVGLGGVQASAQPFIGRGGPALCSLNLKKTLLTSCLADQYTEQTWRIRVAKNGKQVVEIPEVTIQYIYNVYYWYVESTVPFKTDDFLY